MGAGLPELSIGEFTRRLVAATPGTEISLECIASLFEHYQELRRWNRGLSLVGPGTAEHVVERHFAESLEGCRLIPRGARTLVDLGSGGGFPGLVLAAARPTLEVFLIEARERKWAFLEAAKQRAALSATILNARVGPAIPEGLPSRIDVLTVRAVRLSERVLEPLLARLSAAGSVLLWVGEEVSSVLGDLELVAVHPIAGSRHRRIAELKPRRSQEL